MTVRNVPSVAYPTIQAAVNASQPGDTVRVAAGTFSESVGIGANKDRVAIIGAGIGETILQGPGTFGFNISESAWVTITGFTINGFTNGIFIDTNDNVIRDVAVTNSTGSGIYGTTIAPRNLFLRVLVRNSGGDGIELNGVNNYVIASEFHNNNDDGIDFNTPDNLALENTATGNDRGLDSVGNRTLILFNSFTGNQAGIGIASDENLIYGNSLEGNLEAGADLVNLENSLVLENEAEGNQGQGIRLGTGTGNRILLNEVEQNRQQGIDIRDGAQGNLIDENEVEENLAAGIRLASATTNNAVRRNELEGNIPDIEALPPANTNNLFDENECCTSNPPGLCAFCDD